MFPGMRKYCFLLISFVLGGCVSRGALLPREVPRIEAFCYRVEVVRAFGLPRESLIVAAADKNGEWRWRWYNALGMPLARQRLGNGRWKDDGFLPLYPQARQLFAALLYLESPPRTRARIYPRAFEVNESGETSVYLREEPSEVSSRGEKLFSLQKRDSPVMLLTLYPSREQFRLEKLSDD